PDVTNQADNKTPEPVKEEPKGDPVYINKNAAEMTGQVRFYSAFAEDVGSGALIAEFNKYYPNIEVILTTYKNNNDGNVAVDTAMVGGQVDVLLSFGVANTLARWENNLFVDITDRLKADNLDLVKEWGTETYKLKDRVYSFPSGAMSYYVAINMDMWNEAGLGDIPSEWTWDEYLEACRKMTKDGVFGGVDYSDKDSWTHRVSQVKGANTYYNAEGLADFDSALFAKALQIEVDAEKEGIWYTKPNMSANNLRNRQLFLGGTVATSVDSILTRYITSIEHDFMIGYAPYPVMEKGQTNYMAGPKPNSHIGISSKCQDVEAAYAFAKFAATYGNKYMYASGHAGTWTGNDASEILEVVFGTLEEAKKWVDPVGFNEYVVSAGQTSYSEDYIVAYNDLYDMILEYTDYVLVGDMTVEEMMKEIKKFGDEAIEDKK
ncbi:MAG: extracellular solute-binding protein, partial [Clostridiales bacterium]|nr:extracellular solute-binding protein [Clostridiales bacterium]